MNIEGNQAAFLFAVPSNGMSQETSAIYEPGITYVVSAGLVGSSSFAPPEGTTLSLSLYYRESETNLVTIASRDVIYNATNFPSLSNLVYFAVASQPLTNNHPALGKNVGVAITSTVAPAGGIWDIDNVTLAAEQLSLTVARVENNLRITWNSRDGATYQLQTSSDLMTWNVTGAPIIGTGSTQSSDVPVPSAASYAFFRLRVGAE